MLAAVIGYIVWAGGILTIPLLLRAGWHMFRRDFGPRCQRDLRAFQVVTLCWIGALALVAFWHGQWVMGAFQSFLVLANCAVIGGLNRLQRRRRAELDELFRRLEG